MGGEAALGAEAKSIEEQLKAKGGQFDIEAITMQYPVVYEESMNTVSQLPDLPRVFQPWDTYPKGGRIGGFGRPVHEF